MRRYSMSTGVQQCGSGLAIKGGVNGEILIISFPPFPSLFPVSVVQTAPPFENCVSVSFSEPREERHIPPLSFTLKKVSVSHRRSRCTSSTFYSRFTLFFWLNFHDITLDDLEGKSFLLFLQLQEKIWQYCNFHSTSGYSMRIKIYSFFCLSIFHSWLVCIDEGFVSHCDSDRSFSLLQYC